MGPLLLTGLTVFGALIAIGLIAASPARIAERGALRGRTVTPARRLGLILVAFATGCGVLGVLVGLLAIELGARLEPGSTRLLVTLVVAGALIAGLVIVREIALADRWLVVRAVSVGGGLVGLAIAIAILSLVIHKVATGSTPSWAYLVLGLIAAGAVIGLGIAGERALREIARLDDATGNAAVPKMIVRIVPFEAVGYGASLVALALVVLR